MYERHERRKNNTLLEIWDGNKSEYAYFLYFLLSLSLCTFDDLSLSPSSDAEPKHNNLFILFLLKLFGVYSNNSV